MVRRAKKTATRKKTTARKTSPRKRAAPLSKTTISNLEQEIENHWKTYRTLQKKVEQSWDKLQEDVRNKQPAHVVLDSKNHLLLLLGECNYMARECMRLANAQKKR